MIRFVVDAEEEHCRTSAALHGAQVSCLPFRGCTGLCAAISLQLSNELHTIAS